MTVHYNSPDQIVLFSEPRARATDPETSLDAAKRVEPSAESLERMIMMAFALRTRMTDEELVAYPSLQHRKPGSVVTARSRLKKRGLLATSQTKRKNAGGCDMQVWHITRSGYESLGWRV